MAIISIATLNGKLYENSVANSLATIWRESGHEIRVGRDFDPKADVAILHHDLSTISPEKIPVAPSGITIVNGAALDIRKRGYSMLRVERDTDWAGEVLVKTDANYFGIPEKRGRRRPLLDTQLDRLAALNWKLARRLPHRTYPVVNHVRRVPRWVWNDPTYIVERFMPEREDDLYCLRGWMFLGKQGYGWRLFSTDPMVKTGSMVRYEYLDETPEELESVRAQCKVDFGKIDYVVHDGRAYVFDVNKTPSFTGDPASPRLRRLASGIDDYLS